MGLRPGLSLGASLRLGRGTCTCARGDYITTEGGAAEPRTGLGLRPSLRLGLSLGAGTCAGLSLSARTCAGLGLRTCTENGVRQVQLPSQLAVSNGVVVLIVEGNHVRRSSFKELRHIRLTRGSSLGTLGAGCSLTKCTVKHGLQIRALYVRVIPQTS